MSRARTSLLLVFASAIMAGCAPMQLFEILISPQKVKPVFKLQSVKTLIMVDDPRGELGSPMNAAVLADRVMRDLKAKKVVADFVPLTELNALKEKLGRQYVRAPIDQIGRQLTADQVIYVKVRSLSLEAAPTMLQPTATLSIKVIDVLRGRRVFPASDEGSAPAAMSYESRMHYRFEDEQAPSNNAQIMREFAERIGRDTARLFYAYEKDPPGEIYER